MNHSYQGNFTNTCAKCGWPEEAHSDSAQCEACEYIGSCNVHNDMLLCPDCIAKEIAVLPSGQPTRDARRERIVELTNRLDKNIPMDRRAYFVGRMEAIVDIERELVESGIENPQFALAEVVEKSIVTARERIVGLQKEIQSLQGSVVADQRYLNQLVPSLREEERAKFKDYDISYKPQAVVTAPATTRTNKPRQSASDKAVESYAKMLGISVEKAKQIMANVAGQMTGNKCTCAETPGMCKIHPKGL